MGSILLGSGELNGCVSNPLSLALPVGRLLDELRDILKSAGISFTPEDVNPRRLIFAGQAGIQAMTVRPSDVPTYVEQGAADIGIVGEDVLVESHRAVVEIADLEVGVCRMVLAVPVGSEGIVGEARGRPLRIATKYPDIAAGYFRSKGRQVEIIRLSGSVEVAPLAGLADAIVDICSTGATLRDNGLIPLEDLFTVSARLIANPESLGVKRERILEVASALTAGLPGRRRLG